MHVFGISHFCVLRSYLRIYKHFMIIIYFKVISTVITIVSVYNDSSLWSESLCRALWHFMSSMSLDSKVRHAYIDDFQNGKYIALKRIFYFVRDRSLRPYNDDRFRLHYSSLTRMLFLIQVLSNNTDAMHSVCKSTNSHNSIGWNIE